MDTDKPRLNPWFSMWTKPRATIQQIVDEDPERLIVVLVSLSGVDNALSRASAKNLGDIFDWPIIILIAVIVGPIGGMVTLYIGSALVRWTGTWLGGTAPLQNIQSAMAWSCVPVIWALPLWIPKISLLGHELFTTETPTIDANPAVALVVMAYAVVETTIGVWTIVIYLKCLGQVQGFSAWKALGNSVLAGLLVIVPIVLVLLGIELLRR